MTRSQRIGLVLGPVLFLVMLLVPTPPGMTPEAARTAAVVLWVATWWLTEAIPLPATSLLPLVLLPLTAVLSAAKTSANYGDPIIFLFLGGFLIALALERCGLHQRIALGIIQLVGTSPARVVLGFMIATAFLSMWVSNTATVMLMLPTALAVIRQLAHPDHGESGFGTALMLGIAYAGSIGGMATLVGTPPNIVLAGAAQELAGLTIGFAQWMAIGVPLAVIGIAGSWWYLTRLAHRVPTAPAPGSAALIKNEISKLGPWSRDEVAMAAVFLVVAFGWIAQPWLIKPFLPAINDTVVAIAGAVVLFLIPSCHPERRFMLDWEAAERLPWGVLLLFGGGLAIAEAFETSGLAGWLGAILGGLGTLPPLLVVLGVVTLVIFLTEVTSNTATATMFMPVMAALGLALGLPPITLMAAAALASSCAFMMPVATPPNAIVFGTGHVTIAQMAKAGLWLNLAGIVVVTAIASWWAPVLLR